MYRKKYSYEAWLPYGLRQRQPVAQVCRQARRMARNQLALWPRVNVAERHNHSARLPPKHSQRGQAALLARQPRRQLLPKPQKFVVEPCQLCRHRAGSVQPLVQPK